MLHDIKRLIATSQRLNKLQVESPGRCNVESLEQRLNQAQSQRDLLKLTLNIVLDRIYN
jgi:hypothetical protein